MIKTNGPASQNFILVTPRRESPSKVDTKGGHLLAQHLLGETERKCVRERARVLLRGTRSRSERSLAEMTAACMRSTAAPNIWQGPGGVHPARHPADAKYGARLT